MADEPQVSQQHEYVERRLEYYHIIPKSTWNCILNQNGSFQMNAMVMGHFNNIVFCNINRQNIQ